MVICKPLIPKADKKYEKIIWKLEFGIWNLEFGSWNVENKI